MHWHITLLTMATETIAKEVTALQPIEQISLCSLSPTNHILKEDEADALVDSLTRQGYTVRVEKP